MDYKFKDLVEGFKDGDSQCGEKLLAKLQPLIFSTISKYGFSLDKEDLLQEAALAILEGLHQFDPDKGVAFLVFIKTKLKFHIYNQSRKARTNTYKSVSPFDEEGNDLLENMPDSEEMLEELIIINEDSKRLEEAMKKLDERQQKVIRMHYFEGFTLKDIAQMLGVSYKTVLRVKSKGLENLAKDLSLL